MSIQSASVLSASPAVGNLNLLPVAQVLPAQPSTVSDLVEVSSLEMAGHVPVIPDTDFHLRVEFENGRDRVVSFNGCVKPDTDGVRHYVEAQLSNFHINGLPVEPDVVDALFENAVDQLEQWLIAEEEASR
jgi:hypothetical protein